MDEQVYFEEKDGRRIGNSTGHCLEKLCRIFDMINGTALHDRSMSQELHLMISLEQ